MISYGRQSIDECDIQAVVDCLRSDFLTQGPRVPKFEQTLATLVGAEHAVAVNSGTLQSTSHAWRSALAQVIMCGHHPLLLLQAQTHHSTAGYG